MISTEERRLYFEAVIIEPWAHSNFWLHTVY